MAFRNVKKKTFLNNIILKTYKQKLLKIKFSKETLSKRICYFKNNISSVLNKSLI